MAQLALRLLLAGDVMTGRGIDQVLAAPGDPTLHEAYVKDARDYVTLAERANGPIPAPVGFAWPWGDLLPAMEALARDAVAHGVPTVRVMNLETSVTGCDDAEPGKGIHYRMAPGNVGCLLAAGVDVWTLANNHVLDYGRAGLAETLGSLSSAGLRTAGAGPSEESAWAPAVVPLGPAAAPHRLLVWSVAHSSSGTPASWAVGPGRPGVARLADLSPASADALAEVIAAHRHDGDVGVVSVHWGSNWGYAVADDMVRFAHRLAEAGCSVVHGHSSHHPRPFEVYDGALILYGCGDIVNDYEGITGAGDRYRDDLRLLWAADLDGDGRLLGLRMVPVRARRLRLEPAPPADAAWLASTLTTQGSRFGSVVRVDDEGLLALVPG